MELTGPKETIARARALRSSMSLPERLLWRALRSKQLGLRFRKQHPAGPYLLDFYCLEARLCVEVDGQQHDFTSLRDAARDRWLAPQGVRTLRVRASDVLQDLEAVIRLIESEASAPTAALRAPPPPEGEGF